MKRSIVVFMAMAATAVQAQTLDDGIKMYRYERYTSAQKILAPLAAANPLANYYYGLTQLEQNNVDAAKATFAKFPDDAANIAGQARIAFDQNNIPTGTQLANNAAQKAKKKEWQPLEYAGDAITYSDVVDPNTLQQAITWYKKALEGNENAYVRISLGDAYQKLSGGGGDAMTNYEAVTDKDPKNSLALSRIGALWYSARNYQSALDNYAKAKDADPTNPLPYRNLANAYERVGKYDLSLQNMQQYLALSDKSADDEIQYAGILYLSKNYADAIKLADSLINSGVKNAGLYGILGYSQNEMKDTANALKNVRAYFSMKDPKKIPYPDYVKFGNIFSGNSMPDSADAYYAKAASLDTAKDRSDLYRPIAENFRIHKDYTRAAIWYSKIYTENPDAQPTDYFWGGAMYYYAKDYNDAAASFQKMEAKYPTQPSATYWRGRVAAAIDSEGKTGLAVPFYTKWLDTVTQRYEKKNDVKMADDYMLIYYYNAKDAANEEKYKEYLKAIDPNDATLKQIIEIESTPAKKQTQAKTPPKKK